MLLYFNRKNEINNFSLQISFKLFAELLSEAYLEPNWTSRMELFGENSKRELFS